MNCATCCSRRRPLMDLIAIDIQRERDLGIGSLNQTREALGLTPYTDFNQITSDPTVACQSAKGVQQRR